MIEFLSSNLYFGIALTLAMFCLAVMFNKRWPSPFTTPLFLGTVFVVIILLLLRIPYSAYNEGARYLTYFLVPVTVCFAVPMYRQLPLLKKHGASILLAMLVGVVSSVFSVALICVLFGLGDVFAKSLVSISVTTAIAVGITEKLGGIIAITTSAVIITGVLGASVSDLVCRILGLKNPIARGLAIGNASHAAGTVKAMEMGRVEGAMSSLAIVLSGLMTAIVAPLAIYWLF
ncbi:MAG: LrgB family protein [Rickettsiales bacterium]|jgi:predicted murein hydrolase (TIGR00659 family)|nr:LrgB family protein [Rickettsiales bacterium]